MPAGFLGGWFDRFINLLLINAFLSFPGILLAIAFAAFFGPGIGKVILVLIITGGPGTLAWRAPRTRSQLAALEHSR